MCIVVYFKIVWEKANATVSVYLKWLFVPYQCVFPSIYYQTFRFGEIFESCHYKASYAHQGHIYLILNIVKL